LFDKAAAIYSAAGDKFAEEAQAARDGAAHSRLGFVSTQRDRVYALGQGNITQAIHLTKQQIDLRPDAHQYWFDLATMYVALSEVDEHAADEAVSAFKRAQQMKAVHLRSMNVPSAGNVPGLDCEVDESVVSISTPSAETELRLEKVFISGPDALIVSADCQITATSGSHFNSIAANLPVPNPSRGPAPMPSIPPVARSLSTDRKSPLSVAPVFSLLGYSAASFYHFLCEALPRLVAMRDSIVEAAKLTGDPSPASPPPRLLYPDAAFAKGWLELLLDTMQVRARLMPYSSAGPFPSVYVEQLVTYVWPEQSHSLAPPHLLHTLRDLLLTKGRPFQQSDGRKLVIWLTRARKTGQSSTSRVLHNEQQVLELITTHFPSSLYEVRSFDPSSVRLMPAQTISLFARAHAVLGVHGGAMANILLCRPGTLVLELGFRSQFLQHYAHVSHAIGLKYYHAALVADPRGAGQESVTANLKSVANALSDMMPLESAFKSEL
jgi:capsular polysaccharide biosynthesis protein